MRIDWPYIEQDFVKILNDLIKSDPLDQWSIQPRKLAVTQHKTKYGMADLNGVVYINQAFVGTSAVELLAATIRHELAHLCVGLQHGHDQYFKAKAHQFKANFGRHLNAESEQFRANMGYKYRLYARIENPDCKSPEEILFKRVHRKHSKYLNYKPRRFRYLTIKGRKVIGFRYD